MYLKLTLSSNSSVNSSLAYAQPSIEIVKHLRDMHHSMAAMFPGAKAHRLAVEICPR